jgi:hypothetical protein
MRRSCFLVIVILAFSLTAAAQGRGNSGNKGAAAPAGKDSQAGREDRVFTVEHERIIRAWFSDPANLRGLPPGLAKKEQLPPGLQRQLVKNGKLPPGLDKKVQPFPPQLEARLPRLSGGWIRVVLGGNVMVIDVNTNKILDILADIF